MKTDHQLQSMDRTGVMLIFAELLLPSVSPLTGRNRMSLRHSTARICGVTRAVSSQSSSPMMGLCWLLVAGTPSPGSGHLEVISTVRYCKATSTLASGDEGGIIKLWTPSSSLWLGQIIPTLTSLFVFIFCYIFLFYRLFMFDLNLWWAVRLALHSQLFWTSSRLRNTTSWWIKFTFD